MKTLFIYLIIINAAGLLLMLGDKGRAKEKLRRIPEAALWCCALIGGSLGCLWGMYIGHHKTRKPLFAIGMPILLLLQIAVVLFLVI